MSDVAANEIAMDGCPFCLAEKRADALVCQVCGRDTSPPLSLLQERNELRSRRDALVEEIAAKTKRLTM